MGDKTGRTFQEWGELFEASGPQVGDPMPDEAITDADGQPASLSSLWGNGKPAVLISACYTCPVARSRIPVFTEGIQQYGDDIARGILYTMEAHPKGSPSPHSTKEWLTPANEREGILERQPETLEERLALAKKLQPLVPSWSTYVDGMQNNLYQRFGTAPCMALLIDADGVIRVKMGWLNPEELTAAVHALMAGADPAAEAAAPATPPPAGVTLAAGS